ICDETIPEPGPYCPVSVESKNGKRFEYTAKIAKGDPRNPMSESEVTEKFRGNAKAVLPEDRATNLLTVVQNLETVDNVQKLVTLLSPV
ncbi:MAG TPA: hypothetical protein VGA27_14375, partial [Candidatus Binatia bacterium]